MSSKRRHAPRPSPRLQAIAARRALKEKEEGIDPTDDAARWLAKHDSPELDGDIFQATIVSGYDRHGQKLDQPRIFTVPIPARRRE